MKTQHPNVNHNLNPRPGQSASNQNGSRRRKTYTDLSRGTEHCNGRPNYLCLGAEIREDYVELNPERGMNWVGVILPALAKRYVHCPQGKIEGMITVRLHRQRDHELVEVDLEIQRVEKGASGSFMLLRRVAERPVKETEAQPAQQGSPVRPEGRGGGGGNRPDEGQLYRWKFCLQDDPPGPSFGDAMEFIEGFGINPWSFEHLEVSQEWREGPMAVTEFEVVGTQKQLEELREACRWQTGQVGARAGGW